MTLPWSTWQMKPISSVIFVKSRTIFVSRGFLNPQTYVKFLLLLSYKKRTLLPWHKIKRKILQLQRGFSKDTNTWLTILRASENEKNTFPQYHVRALLNWSCCENYSKNTFEVYFKVGTSIIEHHQLSDIFSITLQLRFLHCNMIAHLSVSTH